MSKPSRSAQSGLKSVQRDFETSSQASQPTEIDSIYWPLTPGPKALSGVEQRLKDIQDALSGRSVLSEGALTNSLPQHINKRPAATAEALPIKKPRQLPPSFYESQNVTSQARPSVHTRPDIQGTTTTVTGALPTSKSKVAAVFLSQEQNQILKLVQEGDSVFYTGSAGECILNKCVYMSCST
jgi:ATP-dependent DNA helicase PIF1